MGGIKQFHQMKDLVNSLYPLMNEEQFLPTSNDFTNAWSKRKFTHGNGIM